MRLQYVGPSETEVHQSEQGDYSKHMQIQWAHLTSNTMCEKPMEQDTSYNMQKESTKQNGNEF